MKSKYILLFLLLNTALGFGQSARNWEFLPPFNFKVDSVSLLATWEAPKIVLLDEDFEGDVFPPEGWAESTMGAGWMQTNDPDFLFWYFPVPAGSFALVNDDLIFDNNGSLDYLITPSLDLTVTDSFNLVFDSYFDGGYGQQAFIEYSIDNGTTWQMLHQLDASLEWENVRVNLSDLSGTEGASNIRIAFHADDNGYFASGWVIDNVILCSDSNPDEVLGYEVFQGPYYSFQVNTTYYQYSFWYGNVLDCGVQALYQDGVSETVWQNVHSYFLRKPDSLIVSVPGNAAILEWDLPHEDGCKPGAAGNRDVGEVISVGPAPAPITSCWGICDDGTNLWITDPDLSSTNIYEVSYDLVATGNVITISEGQSWIGDMVSDCQFLYACLVGGPNSIAKVDLLTGETVETIDGGFSIAPQTGLAADFINEEFYIGGGTSNRIWRTDFSGETISTFPFNNVSGLSFDPRGNPDDQGSLWIIACDAGNLATEVEPDFNWAIIQSFQMPGEPFSGAGAEIKRSGDFWGGTMWLCDQVDNKIYLVDLTNPGGAPDRNLIGFNIYKNGAFLDYIGCTDQSCCQYNDPVDFSEQTVYTYEVTAVYNLSGYCFPVDTGESLPDGPAEIYSCCWNELDFFEDWPLLSNGNHWRFSGDNWKVDPVIGNEAPSAVFSPDSILFNYRDSLQTLMIYNDFAQVDMTLSYDISLSSATSTGNEKLMVQVNDYSNSDWTTLRIYDNTAGSFGWMSETVNPAGYFTHNKFRIRFLVEGGNSADISYWAVDNIALTRICSSPRYLGVHLLDPEEDSVLITWSEPMPELHQWWQHDDGSQYSKLGFNAPKNDWFSIAVRWSPEQLADINGASLTAIGFIPGEGSAFYKIAVWQGEEKELVYLQGAGNLIIDQWNIIPLEVPYEVDVTKDFLVGYKLAEYMNSPISVDNGPAVDGYGNLIQVGLNGGWGTLLQNGYNYNWNIKAYFERDGVPFTGYYRITRSIDDNEPEVIAETTVNEYYDSIDGGMGLYCYSVTTMFGDTCLYSESQNVNCIVLTQTPSLDPGHDIFINIYPNPASDVLFIEASEEIENVTIFDSKGITMEQWNNGTVERKESGKVVRWYGGKVGGVEIPVDGLAPGLYFVRVETGSGVVARKVIVGR